jgi:hypothetical protein
MTHSFIRKTDCTPKSVAIALRRANHLETTTA